MTIPININKSELDNITELFQGIDITITPESVLSELKSIASDNLDINTPNLNVVQNTSVLVTTNDNANIVEYRRIDIKKQFDIKVKNTNIYNQENKILVDFELTKENMLNYIKDKVSFIENSFNIAENINSNNASITITAKDNSYLYIGSLKLDFIKNIPEIPEEETTVVELDGFEEDINPKLNTITFSDFNYEFYNEHHGGV